MAFERLGPMAPNRTSHEERLRASLPNPEVYELEYRYWPWGGLIDWIAGYAAASAPIGGVVFDYMCGTGFLLARIATMRGDLRLEGCDIHGPFVEFAELNHAGVRVHHADALVFVPDSRPDFVLCTGGLHHLDFEQQEVFLDKLVDEAGTEATIVIGEESIGEYETELSRRIAALRFNAKLIEYGLIRAWPAEQIDAAIEVMKNDVMGYGEYKRSLSQWKAVIGKRFQIQEIKVFWSPENGEGGDVVFVCSRAK